MDVSDGIRGCENGRGDRFWIMTELIVVDTEEEKNKGLIEQELKLQPRKGGGNFMQFLV